MIEAVVCYIKQQGKTLFIEHIKSGRFNGPGGKLKNGETPEQAVIREILEETGLTVLDPIYKGQILMPPTSYNGNDDNLVHVFIATKTSGELKESDEGKLIWVPDDSIEALKRWDSDKLFWHLIDQPVTFKLKMIYEGDTFIKPELTVEQLTQ